MSEGDSPPPEVTQAAEKGSGTAVAAKTKEVVERIKAREESEGEGRGLFEAYLKALAQPKAIPFVSEGYLLASSSRGNLDQPGEANKLVASLGALYKQAGLAEGYQPKIEVEAGLSEEEKATLITRRVAEDFDGVGKKLAENYIERYAKTRAKFILAEENLQAVVGKDELSRTEVRQGAYRLDLARRGLVRQVEASARRISQPEVGQRITESLNQSWQYQREEEGQFAQLDKDQQKERLQKSLKAYQKLPKESAGGNVGLIDQLDEAEQTKLFTPLAEIDFRLQNLRAELGRAINASPEALSDLVSEIKGLQAESRIAAAEVRVALAETRSESVKKRWPKIRENLGENFFKLGRSAGEEAWNSFAAAAKERLASSVGVHAERLSASLSPVLETISQEVAGAKEAASGVIERLKQFDTAFLRPMAEAFSSSKEKFTNCWENLRNRRRRAKARQERKRIIRRRNYYQGRHTVESWANKQRASLVVKAKRKESLAKERIKGVVGGKVVRGKYQERAGEIKRITGEDFRRRVAEIRQAENPHLKAFQVDLRERVPIIVETAEALFPSPSEGKDQPVEPERPVEEARPESPEPSEPPPPPEPSEPPPPPLEPEAPTKGPVEEGPPPPSEKKAAAEEENPEAKEINDQIREASKKLRRLKSSRNAAAPEEEKQKLDEEIEAAMKELFEALDRLKTASPT